jgi:protein-tyrosine phosphatase
MAVDDGISTMVCTPHVVPGLYDNDASGIADAVGALQRALLDAGIPLTLKIGADVHIAPDLPEKLARNAVPTLNGSRYFLFEPPHHVLPPKIEDLTARLIDVGFVPILTHPERLTWIKGHYSVIERLNDQGCLIQLTAAAVTGGFGRSARYYAERLLDEGRVDFLATDTHNVTSRPPMLAKARDAVAARLGADEAARMVNDRPAMILDDFELAPAARSRGERIKQSTPIRRTGLIGRFLRGQGS